MKVCSRCKAERSLDQFRKQSGRPDGLSVWCKSCYAEYERERYRNGDRDRKERNKASVVDRNRRYVWSVLVSSSCIDCGNSDPEVLEFDHREPSDKSASISEMWFGSLESIKVEIDKCDIRCANCHRKRTLRQFNSWRYLGVAQFV